MNEVLNFIQPKDAWDRLSMREKAEMMKVAVRKGIYNLNDIREKYNEFAEGGAVTNEIAEDYQPLVSDSYQPIIDSMKVSNAGFNIDDYTYRVQKLHPEITKDQVQSLYNATPYIASDKVIGTKEGGFRPGDETGYGRRVTLYPNTYTQNTGTKVTSSNVNETMGDTLAHETNHLYTDILLGGSNETEKDLLFDAYRPGFVVQDPGFNGDYSEERAINAEIRNRISRENGNVIGEELDKAIDNTPDDVLMNMLFDPNNGYINQSGKKHMQDKNGNWNRTDAVRRALKDVAFNNQFVPDNYAALGGPLVQAANKFAKGGDTDTDWSYDNWKRLITEHMGIRPDEDNTYDYEAYFNKYPEEAWKMLKGNPTAHFSDEFKTVYHPTFSSKSVGNDGSIYSGVVNSKTNPQGLVGGTWSPDYHTFTMSSDGYRGPVSMDDRKWYLENAEDNGVQLREADGSLPIYDGIPWGGVLPNITVYGTKHSMGGPIVEAANEYRHGGKIHIKKENRGKFTRLKERTGHSASWFKEHGTPAQKKMAVFALNSRKWKHEDGGNLFDGTSQPTQKMKKVSDYRYVLDDDEEWNRVANDEMGRVFQGLTVTPTGNSGQPAPARYNISYDARVTKDDAKPVRSLLAKIQEVADTPIMVQQTPGTAIGYSSYGQYMPKTQSTFGDQTELLFTELTAPTVLSDAKGIYRVFRHPVQTARAIKEGIGTLYNNVGELTKRPLTFLDAFGNTNELPVRSMRKGLKDINGNILSDEELVANWKRSRDFYKMRLRNKGINQQGHTYTANRNDAISIAKLYEPDASEAELIADLDNLGGAYALPDGNNGYGIVTKELNSMGKQRKGTTNSAYVHESSHLMRSVEEVENMEDINWSSIANLDKDEVAARGTQIKSMLEIKDDTPITPEQLKYMKDNFVRLTGLDNNMQRLLNSITDFDKAAAWLSRNAYTLGGVINTYNFMKHPKGKKGF